MTADFLLDPKAAEDYRPNSVVASDIRAPVEGGHLRAPLATRKNQSGPISTGTTGRWRSPQDKPPARDGPGLQRTAAPDVQSIPFERWPL